MIYISGLEKQNYSNIPALKIELKPLLNGSN